MQENKPLWPSEQYRNTVCVNGAEEYSFELLREILREQLRLLGAEECIRPGVKVVIKPNLVVRAEPDSGAVTHPLVTAAAAACLQELGASVLIAESSGGVYTQAALRSIYTGTGYTEMARQYEVELNYDCSSGELKAPDGLRCKGFTVITPVLEADVVVDICKLKSHCMTGLSGAVKNLFGCVPGLMKPELHCRFPRKASFWGDAHGSLLCGEAGILHCRRDHSHGGKRPNGRTSPSYGSHPIRQKSLRRGRGLRRIDLHEAGRNLYASVGYGKEDYPRALPGELEVLGESLETYIQKDFVQPESKTSNFIEKLPRFLRPLATRLASPAPKIRKEECVGCGKMRRKLPAAYHPYRGWKSFDRLQRMHPLLLLPRDVPPNT